MRWLVILLVALVALGGFVMLTRSADEAPPASAAPPTSQTEVVPPMLGNALSLEGLDGWLQTDIASLEDLRGNVVIVQFWTFGCYNCTNTIPYLRDIYDSYRDSGLEIVGVHAPEFAYERDPDAILAAESRLPMASPEAPTASSTSRVIISSVDAFDAEAYASTVDNVFENWTTDDDDDEEENVLGKLGSLDSGLN